MGLEIAVDENACMAAGECVYFAPNVFEQHGDGTSYVKDPDGEPEEVVVEAARRCPNFAISVSKDGVRLV